MLNHIRHSRLGKGVALVVTLAPLAAPTTALAVSAHAAKTSKCNPKPASTGVKRTIKTLKVTNTTCKEGVKVVNAWGVRGKLVKGKYTPAPCIKGYEGKQSCTVLKYKCTHTLKLIQPAREVVSFSATCKKGKSKVEFAGLITRASA